MTFILGKCMPMSALISERQCKINRDNDHISCKACFGLENIGPASFANQEVLPVATNIRKYVCIEEGCNKVQSKNRRCHLHNKEFLAAQKAPVAQVADERAVSDVVETVISDNIVPLIEPMHFAADGVYLTACGFVSSSQTLLTTNWDAVTCESCLVWAPVVAGTTTGKDDLQVEDCPDEKTVSPTELGRCVRCHGMLSDSGIYCLPCRYDNDQVIAADMAMTTETLDLSPPLAAVLVKLPPPVPPLPDTSIVIDFPREMFDDLVDKGVGTATIIELLDALFVSGTYRLIRHAAD